MTQQNRNQVIRLSKGQSINLTKTEVKLRKLDVGLGWKTKMDLDAIAYLVDNNEKLVDTVYFAHKSNKNKSVVLSGDDLVGGGEGDNEIIYIELDKMPNNVRKIAIYVNIFKFFGFGKKTFSDVKEAYIRIVNRETRKEICRYCLGENGSGYDAFHFADLVKEGNEWKFKAYGVGCNGSVDKLSQAYR